MLYQQYLEQQKNTAQNKNEYAEKKSFKRIKDKQRLIQLGRYVF